MAANLRDALREFALQKMRELEAERKETNEQDNTKKLPKIKINRESSKLLGKKTKEPEPHSSFSEPQQDSSEETPEKKTRKRFIGEADEGEIIKSKRPNQASTEDAQEKKVFHKSCAEECNERTAEECNDERTAEALNSETLETSGRKSLSLEVKTRTLDTLTSKEVNIAEDEPLLGMSKFKSMSSFSKKTETEAVIEKKASSGSEKKTIQIKIQTKLLELPTLPEEEEAKDSDSDCDSDSEDRSDDSDYEHQVDGLPWRTILEDGELTPSSDGEEKEGKKEQQASEIVDEIGKKVTEEEDEKGEEKKSKKDVKSSSKHKSKSKHRKHKHKKSKKKKKKSKHKKEAKEKEAEERSGENKRSSQRSSVERALVEPGKSREITEDRAKRSKSSSRRESNEENVKESEENTDVKLKGKSSKSAGSRRASEECASSRMNWETKADDTDIKRHGLQKDREDSNKGSRAQSQGKENDLDDRNTMDAEQDCGQPTEGRNVTQSTQIGDTNRDEERHRSRSRSSSKKIDNVSRIEVENRPKVKDVWSLSSSFGKVKEAMEECTSVILEQKLILEKESFKVILSNSSKEIIDHGSDKIRKQGEKNGGEKRGEERNREDRIHENEIRHGEGILQGEKAHEERRNDKAERRHQIKAKDKEEKARKSREKGSHDKKKHEKQHEEKGKDLKPALDHHTMTRSTKVKIDHLEHDFQSVEEYSEVPEDTGSSNEKKVEVKMEAAPLAMNVSQQIESPIWMSGSDRAQTATDGSEHKVKLEETQERGNYVNSVEKTLIDNVGKIVPSRTDSCQSGIQTIVVVEEDAGNGAPQSADAVDSKPDVDALGCKETKSIPKLKSKEAKPVKVEAAHLKQDLKKTSDVNGEENRGADILVEGRGRQISKPSGSLQETDDSSKEKPNTYIKETDALKAKGAPGQQRKRANQVTPSKATDTKDNKTNTAVKKEGKTSQKSGIKPAQNTSDEGEKRDKRQSDENEEGAIDSEIEEGEIAKKHKKSKKKDKKRDRTEKDRRNETEKRDERRDRDVRGSRDKDRRQKRRHSGSRPQSRSSHKKHKRSRSRSHSDGDGDSDISIEQKKMVEKSFYSESRGCWVNQMVPRGESDESSSSDYNDGNEPYDIGDTYIEHAARDRRSVFERLGGGHHNQRDRSERERYDRQSRYGYRRRRRSYSRSRSRSPRMDIDKKKLLEIAKANALLRMRAGDLPANIPIPDSIKKAADSYEVNQSIQELTARCKALVNQGGSSDDDSPVRLPLGSDDDEEHGEIQKPFVRHPFKVREAAPIVMNIKNAVQIPVASKDKLRVQFPVSSGSQHRKKEEEIIINNANDPYGQWTAVEKPESKAKPAAVATAPSPASSASTPCSSATPSATSTTVMAPAAPLAVTAAAPAAPAATPSVTAPHFPGLTNTQQPKPVAQEDKVFEDASEFSYDIGQIVSARLKAARALQSNPNNVEALTVLHHSQRQIQTWAHSSNKPGLFTGSTDATFLKPAQLGNPNPKNQAWIRKDMFLTAAPVSTNIGRALMQKMGWKQGEGLGKDKKGSVNPLLLEIKTDRQGLVAAEEKPKRKGDVSKVIRKDLSGKHPVMALNELCNKRRWGKPVFETLREDGPAHKKNFVFKVRIGNEEYIPTVTSGNKKDAKAMAATVALQKMGLLPM